MNQDAYYDDIEMNLWEAARTGDIDLLDMRIHYGDIIDVEDDYGWTPLLHACTHGHLNMVKWLLDRGVKLITDKDHGWRALFYASAGGHFDIVKLLFERAARLIKLYNWDVAALKGACFGDNADIVHMLIELGVDVTELRGYTFSAKIKSLVEDSGRIRARYLLKLWRAALPIWRITNFWWKVAGEGQHAP
tara:strand:+ start:2954 stop:3526 length:573 start_codon:yes stop_codon:yes gene_type:complete